MHQKMKFLKDIVDHTPLPIAVFTGEQLQIELANTAMIRAWGKGDQIVGRNYLDVLPEVIDDVFFSQATGVMKTGIPFHAKDKLTELVVDGVRTRFYFNYSFIPLFDSDGAVYGVMNTGVDVTDLHLAKLQVEGTEERLRMALDVSGIGAYEIDLRTDAMTTSGKFNAICAAESFESVGQMTARLHPDDLSVREKAHRDAALTGKISYDARVVSEGHLERWTHIEGKIVKDEQGAPAAIIGTIQDISEQRRFEDELKRQVAERTIELQRSNADLMQFAGVVSHDLREPLRKIKIFSGMLNDGQQPLDARAARFIAKIDQSAERMGGIIEGILAYSTLDKTMQPLENISLNTVLGEIKTDLELLIKERGAVFTACDLPEIQGASILISQLFYNLVHNALKFSKADVPPMVTISCEPCYHDGTESIQIAVRDNGIGIDPVYAEQIFGAFERLHSKDDYEGNGLGLALCRKIVERHHGAIKATGEKGMGAEFTVTLPFKQPVNSI